MFIVIILTFCPSCVPSSRFGARRLLLLRFLHFALPRWHPLWLFRYINVWCYISLFIVYFRKKESTIGGLNINSIIYQTTIGRGRVIYSWINIFLLIVNKFHPKIVLRKSRAIDIESARGRLHSARKQRLPFPPGGATCACDAVYILMWIPIVWETLAIMFEGRQAKCILRLTTVTNKLT